MDLLDRILGHDAWTTRQLLDIAAKLTDEELDREFDIAHRSVRRTFEHMIWNEECWTDLMVGDGIRPRPEGVQTVANLIQRHESATALLQQVARKVLEERRLDDTFIDVGAPPKTFGGAIVHVTSHGMHHRAQLLYMLRRLGVADVPEGDALCWEHSCSTSRAD